MLQISKNEADYIRARLSDPYITICSKRKKGSKGSTVSGKTYYCPETDEHIKLLRECRNTRT